MTETDAIRDEIQDTLRLDSLVARYARCQRRIAVNKKIADESIEQYKKKTEAWLKKANAEHNREIAELMPYIMDIVKRLTADKKRKSVRVPSGMAGYRSTPQAYTFNGVKADSNNEDFINALLEKNSPFVKLRPELDWAGLKKVLIVEGDTVCTTDGEIIEGLAPAERVTQFYITDYDD